MLIRSIILTAVTTLVMSVSLASGQRGPRIIRGPIRSNNAWVNYVSNEGGFSVQFPDTVGARQFPYDRSLPYLVTTEVDYDSPANQRFEVSFVDFQGSLDSPAEFNRQRLESVVKEIVDSGGTLVKQAAITAGNCHGEEAILRVTIPISKAPSLVKARAFYSGTMVYFLFFGGGSDTPAEGALADRFLNSFKVTGGCRDSPPGAKHSRPPPWFTGTLDPETGWNRVDSPYGISFLFPSSGDLTWERDQSQPGVIRHYTYSFASEDYQFSAEIFDGYAPVLRASTAQRGAALDTYLAKTKKVLEAGGYKFGPCKEIRLGEIVGRECELAVAGSEVTGRARIFVTPARTFLLTAFRNTAAIDEKPLAVFFSSMRIL